MSSTSPRNFNYTLPAHIWATLSDDERNEFARFRRKNLAFKTRLCREFNETGFCSYGAACGFAHSVDELKLVKANPKAKTVLCRNFTINGYCNYGHRCQFIHTEPHRVPLHQPPRAPLQPLPPTQRQFPSFMNVMAPYPSDGLRLFPFIFAGPAVNGNQYENFENRVAFWINYLGNRNS